MRSYSTKMALMKLLFFFFGLLFTLQEIISLRVTSPSLDPQYDITASLNQYINELFHVINNVTVTELSEVLPFRKLKPDQAKYETENVHKIKPFGDKILFQDITVKITEKKGVGIHWEISNNTMRIFYSELRIRTEGYMHIQPEQPYCFFRVGIEFDNVSIIAKEVPIYEHDREIEIIGIEYAKEEMYDIFRATHVKYGDYKIILGSALIPMLCNHLNQNEEFLNTLKTIFSHQPKRKITSQYPHFTENGRHHYLIPSISYSSHSKLNLNSIVFTTLTNFLSLTIKEWTICSNSRLIQMLSAKDVQGSLQVEHGIPNRNPIKLNFTSDIVISFDGESRRISVEAQNYSFIQTSPKISNSSWLSKYSRVLMYVIEERLAKNIMPSMEVWRIRYSNLSTAYNMKISIKRMLEEIAQQFEETDDTLNQHSSNISTAIELTNRTKIKSYTYQILFDDMIMKLITDTPCEVEQTRCSFPKNSEVLRIHHRVILETKQPIPGFPIIVHFHGNFTPINFVIVNQKKSQDNNTCELEFSNNQDIKVSSMLVVSSSTDNGDESNTKEKIDFFLMTIAKKRLIQAVKPLVCLPIEICNQFKKIADDFFLFFIGKVMEKCSFKTNK